MPLSTSPFNVLPPDTEIYSSQSATSCYKECPRRYLFQYRLYGTGIVPKFSSVPLLAGGCLHKAVENIATQYLTGATLGKALDIDIAVAVAKEAYLEEVGKRPLHATQLEDEEEQQFVIAEQMALVEAMVRLWYMKEWPKLVEHYDILAVEQEIQFQLGPVIYQVKPDLILVHRINRDVINYSLKGVKMGGDRLEKNYKVQLQAFTEPYGTSIWLGILKEILDRSRGLLNESDTIPTMSYMSKGIGTISRTLDKYSQLPTKSSGTRFCYVIKGDRKETKRGNNIYRTDNPFIYGLRKIGVRDIEYAWSWFYNKPENASGWGRLGKGWEQFPVWENGDVGGVKGWMEMLAENRGVQGDIGEGHVLDKHLLSQPDVFSNWALIESKVRQTQQIEESILNGLKYLEDSGDINRTFPMNEGSCFFPTPCDYLSICPNGNDYYKEHIAVDPLNEEWGRFERRTSHHEPERLEFEKLKEGEGRPMTLVEGEE